MNLHSGAVAHFRALVLAELDRQKVSLSELARRMGVSPPLVSRLLNDGESNNMTISTMSRLAAALGKKVTIGLSGRRP